MTLRWLSGPEFDQGAKHRKKRVATESTKKVAQGANLQGSFGIYVVFFDEAVHLPTITITQWAELKTALVEHGGASGKRTGVRERSFSWKHKR